jgi:hypothetical protein
MNETADGTIWTKDSTGVVPRVTAGNGNAAYICAIKDASLIDSNVSGAYVTTVYLPFALMMTLIASFVHMQ